MFCPKCASRLWLRRGILECFGGRMDLSRKASEVLLEEFWIPGTVAEEVRLPPGAEDLPRSCVCPACGSGTQQAAGLYRCGRCGRSLNRVVDFMRGQLHMAPVLGEFREMDPWDRERPGEIPTIVVKDDDTLPLVTSARAELSLLVEVLILHFLRRELARIQPPITLASVSMEARRIGEEPRFRAIWNPDRVELEIVAPDRLDAVDCTVRVLGEAGDTRALLVEATLGPHGRRWDVVVDAHLTVVNAKAVPFG